MDYGYYLSILANLNLITTNIASKTPSELASKLKIDEPRARQFIVEARQRNIAPLDMIRRYMNYVNNGQIPTDEFDLLYWRLLNAELTVEISDDMSNKLQAHPDIRMAHQHRTLYRDFEKQRLEFDRRVQQGNHQNVERENNITTEIAQVQAELERGEIPEEVFKRFSLGDKISYVVTGLRSDDTNSRLTRMYGQLDNLKQKSKTPGRKRKFKKKDQEKIAKLQRRIAELKVKQGMLVKKQTKIINKNTNKYLRKKAKQLRGGILERTGRTLGAAGITITNIPNNVVQGVNDIRDAINEGVDSRMGR